MAMYEFAIGLSDGPHQLGAVDLAVTDGIARGVIPPVPLIVKPCKFAVKPGCNRRTTAGGKGARHMYTRSRT